MKGKKTIAVLVTVLVLLAALVAGMLWCVVNYYIVDFKFYPKNAAVLDLRDREISAEHYEKLREKMPNCQILWNVTVQGKQYSSDSTKVAVSKLTDADVEAIAYLENLKTVSARGCTDYARLQELQEQNPELEVIYTVQIEGQAYAQNAAKVYFSEAAEEEVAKLQYLPGVTNVIAREGRDPERLKALQETCHEKGISFHVMFGQDVCTEDAQELTVTATTDAELNLLNLLPNLKQVHFVSPEASAENLIALREKSGLEVTWERNVYGVMVTSEDVEVDISYHEVDNLQELEHQMEYFPDAEKLIMSYCGIENPTMAAFRELHREDYKVVWTVTFNGKLPTRTDETDFFPSRDGMCYFSDVEAYNLRYCEDMVCIDVGHMTVKNVGHWLSKMPNLEYLILAHTQVQYIDGIENCKKLKFLELDWSCIRDLDPLVGCVSLEDLNIGLTWPDTSALQEMPWLKNVYMIGGSQGDAWKISQACPDTRVVTRGGATVGSGWRQLPNYYAMRDYLGVPYMHG